MKNTSFIHIIKKQKEVFIQTEILLNELHSLNLPSGQYVIAASGPMAIHGLREANDLDIVVTELVWEQLKQKYSSYIVPNTEKMQIGHLEIFKCLKANEEIYASFEELITVSEIIEEIPCVKLETIRDYKEKFAREKDLVDIQIIDNYLIHS